MTTIDKTKLKRIITQCGTDDEMDIIRAIWSAAQAEEREECARICESVNSNFQSVQNLPYIALKLSDKNKG